MISEDNSICIENMKALETMEQDSEFMEFLETITKKVNVFDVLKLTRYEIRHSNMLAWLLDPYENHGLGVSVLRGMLDKVLPGNNLDNEKLCSFLVRREWHFIDILAVSVKEKIVLCIENKIDSDEQNDQLNRYRGLLEKLFPESTIILVYLTPDGRMASDQEHWHIMSYEEILRIIDNALHNTGMEISDEAALLIRNYADTIRRCIVLESNDIKEKCEKFYLRHRKALDLIFANRPSIFMDGGETEKPPEKEGFLIYQIREGDTLGKISKAYGITLEQLMQANSSIQDKNCITVGYYIYIPDRRC